MCECLVCCSYKKCFRLWRSSFLPRDAVPLFSNVISCVKENGLWFMAVSVETAAKISAKQSNFWIRTRAREPLTHSSSAAIVSVQRCRCPFAFSLIRLCCSDDLKMDCVWGNKGNCWHRSIDRDGAWENPLFVAKKLFADNSWLLRNQAKKNLIYSVFLVWEAAKNILNDEL